jgi:hypothetical protein
LPDSDSFGAVAGRLRLTTQCGNATACGCFKLMSNAPAVNEAGLIVVLAKLTVGECNAAFAGCPLKTLEICGICSAKPVNTGLASAAEGGIRSAIRVLSVCRFIGYGIVSSHFSDP